MSKNTFKFGDLVWIKDKEFVVSTMNGDDRAICIGDGDNGNLKFAFINTDGELDYVQGQPSSFHKMRVNLGEPAFGTPVITPDSRRGICMSNPIPFPETGKLSVFMIDKQNIQKFDDVDLSVRLLEL